MKRHSKLHPTQILTSSSTPLFPANDSDIDFGRDVLEKRRVNMLLQDGTVLQNRPMIHRGNRLSASFEPDCCFPASTLAFMVISFMIVVFIILGFCVFSVALVRYKTKRRGQRVLANYHASYKPPKPRVNDDSDLAAMELRLQALLRAQRTVQRTKIEAGPKDVAGIVGFLAENEVEDASLEFRPTNTHAVLVPKMYLSSGDSSDLPLTMLSGEISGCHLPPLRSLSIATMPNLRKEPKVTQNKSNSGEKKSGREFLANLWKRQPKEQAKNKRRNSDDQTSSRKENRRVGWSDKEQGHQIITGSNEN